MYTFLGDVQEVAVTVEVVVRETDEKNESAHTTGGIDTSETAAEEVTGVEAVVYNGLTTDSTMFSNDGMDGKGGWDGFP